MVKLPTETKKIMMPGLEKVLELLLLKLTERKEKLSIIGHMSEIISFQGHHRRQDTVLLIHCLDVTTQPKEPESFLAIYAANCRH